MEVIVTPLTSWQLVADCARNTIWKGGLGHEPSDKFKRAMCMSEHSPLRALIFRIDMMGIETATSVHLVRHKYGVEHFVSSNRPDRNGGNENIDRHSPVNHIMVINAQELIFISRRRLCRLASPETRMVWMMVVDALKSVDPILASFCMPNCVYLGRCPEPLSCGKSAITDGINYGS